MATIPRRRPKLRPVSSSSIQRIGYDPEARSLFLQYEGDKLYQYFDVPAKVYTELLAAQSKGRFVNYAIKPHYSFKEV